MPKVNDNSNIELILNTLDRILKRRTKINDPVQRHLLLIDTLTIAIDFGVAGLKTVIEEDKYDEDGDEKPEYTNIMRLYQSVSEQTTQQLEALTDWIQQPTYSPDHPYGRSIYNKAAEDFRAHANTDSGRNSSKPINDEDLHAEKRAYAYYDEPTATDEGKRMK